MPVDSASDCLFRPGCQNGGLVCLFRAAIAGAAIALAAGCAAPAIQQTAQAPRSLTAHEMDSITIGNATATSNGTARAAGTQLTSTTFSKALSIAGGSPITESPFIDYAMSQTQSRADGTLRAHAGAKSQTGVTNAKGSAVNATLNANADGAPPSAHATSALQVFAVSMANGTSVLFGQVSARACCVPHATTAVNAHLTANGRHVHLLQARPTNLQPETSAATIDFAAVSSLLPLMDSSRLDAATTSPRL